MKLESPPWGHVCQLGLEWQEIKGHGMQVGSQSQAGLGGILFLMRFDRLVNAKVFASFNLDQTGDLENKLLCAVGVKLSGSVEMLVFQPAPGWGKIELRALNRII